ncbi:LolA family protein [Streptomyces aureoversilis]|uniref:Outer membrane lipoprotein carrier protein LolA n=1 Tax=Streptomyces aureoversilis TaxID=67277 RepID=A0ABW0A5C7_9ACTN
MARNEPTHGTDGAAGAGESAGRAPGRRKAVRYAVPVAVAGVAAASIGIGTALANSGDPDLPKISAQDLIAKVAKSDAQQLSGTVKITTDLGLPSMPEGLSFGDGGGGKAAGHGPAGKGEGADASPQAKLTELASGTHTLRVAADGPDKQRLSIVERAAEYSLIRNGDQVWAYDSKSNTVHRSTAPKDAKGGKEAPEELRGASPQDLAKKTLAAVDDSTSVSVDGTAKVAGRDAYQLVIKPKQAESTVGAVRIAVDAKNGVPLKFTLAPKGGGKAVVEAAFTKVDFSRPAADTFAFTPPKGAKVTEDKDAKGGKAGADDRKKGLDESGLSGMNVIGKSWTSIAEFKAPGGVGPGAGAKGAKGGKDAGPAGALLDGLGSKVSGSFGSGHVFSTRLVNALVTDDGKVYVGAVTKDALVKAASK